MRDLYMKAIKFMYCDYDLWLVKDVYEKINT